MKRYYYVSDDLNDLAAVEHDLEQSGVNPLQMHLVSDAEAEAERLGLHQVASVFKRDILYSMFTGFVIGFAISMMLLVIAYILGMNSEQNWLLMVAICFMLTGFCTWEGGLFGIQVPNRHYRKFAQALGQGRHLFFVDIVQPQKRILDETVVKHQHLKPIGRGAGEWAWWLSLRSAAYQFVRSAG